jgi:hypothetical protein
MEAYLKGEQKANYIESFSFALIVLKREPASF